MKVFAVLFGVVAITFAFAVETAVAENSLEFAAYEEAIQCINGSILNLDVFKYNHKMNDRTKHMQEIVSQIFMKQAKKKLIEELGEDVVAELQSASENLETNKMTRASDFAELLKEVITQDQVDEGTTVLRDLCTRITDKKDELNAVLNQLVKDIYGPSTEITKSMMVALIKDPETALTTVDEKIVSLMSSIKEKVSSANAAVIEIISSASDKNVE